MTWLKWALFVFIWSVCGPYERIPFKVWKKGEFMNIRMVSVWARVLTGREITLLYEYERFYFMPLLKRLLNLIKHLRLRQQYKRLQDERAN